MHTPVRPSPADPDRMTGRARAYMLVATFRHLTIGVFMLGWPSLFDGPAYDGIRNALPAPERWDIPCWGALFALTGVLCAGSAWLGREATARGALQMSVVTTALLAAGFAASIVAGQRATVGVVLLVALTLKDLVVLQDPLRSPFERLERRLRESGSE